MTKPQSGRQQRLSTAFQVGKRPRNGLSADEARAREKAASLDSPASLQKPKPKLDVALSKSEEERIISDPIYEQALKHMVGSDTATRFHQQDLNTVDKLLRLFDLTADYGPCAGLTRLDRWKRAEKLHQSPPIAVKRALESPLGSLDRYKYSFLQ